jgi:Ca-activated chloride channel family protein
MVYRSPEYFYLLLLVPFLSLFYFLAFKWKKRMLKKFGEDHLVAKLTLTTSSGRQFQKAFLVVLSFIFITVALARPMFGTKLEILKRKGIDIVVALDASNSMLAEDIKPNRIKRAKYEISKLIDKLKGDRVGLVAFAGVAFVQCPITTDYGALKMFLDVLEPTAIASQGTAIGAALRKARSSFNAGPGCRGQKGGRGRHCHILPGHRIQGGRSHSHCQAVGRGGI